MANDIRDTLGTQGGVYIAAGQTAVPSTTTFAGVMPVGGDATLSAHDGSGIASLPSALVLKDGVFYPLKFTTVTLNGASVGELICFNDTPR